MNAKPLYINVFSIILISSLGIIAYLNAFNSSFHFDDRVYILNDPGIRNIQDLRGIWGICPSRFVTFYSLAINYHFHKLHVFGYHVFNMAVHIGSAVLVWWLVLLTLSTPAMKGNSITRHASPIALLAGLVFVSHPLQIEAVTYIWQRATSMAAFFYLASICCYVRSRLSQSSGPGSRYLYILSLIAAAAAMFTKENVITLPLMILAYEYFFLKNRDVSQLLIGGRPYLFLLTIFIIPVTLLMAKSSRFQAINDMTAGNNGISPLDYLITQIRVMVTYIRLAFLPFDQKLDYDYPVYKNIFEIPVLLSWLFLTTILFFAKRLFARYRLVSFSILWFFLALLPESSFLPLKDVIFEHRLYLPMAGYSIFLVSGAYYLWGKDNFKMMAMALTVIIAVNTVLTFERNKIWKDEITLFTDAVEKSPHKARPYAALGVAFNDRGDFVKALSNFNRVIAIDPAYDHAYFNRGTFYERQGDLDRAIVDYNNAIKINAHDAQAYYNRGNIYYKQDKYPQALSDYNSAIKEDPAYLKAYINRGLTYRRLKQGIDKK